MSIKIMEQARESMLERRKQVDDSLVTALAQVTKAQKELEEIDVAVKELEVAIERTRNPRKRSRAVSSRAAMRRNPAEGTKAYVVWRLIVDSDRDVSTGVICSATGIPAKLVSSTTSDLVRRGLIERVSEGFFRAETLRAA